VKNKSKLVISSERIKNVILMICEGRVILNADLSETPFALPKKHPVGFRPNEK
jgi:hypothetical protein